LDYFNLTAAEKLASKLPKNFYVEVYTCMNEWMQHKPSNASINPPHARDTMNPSNGNYGGRDVPVAANQDIGWMYGSIDTRGNDEDWNGEGPEGNQSGVSAPRMRDEGNPPGEFSVVESAQEVFGDGDLPAGNVSRGAFPHPSPATASTTYCRAVGCTQPVQPPECL
jgi:hypothetical protein